MLWGRGGVGKPVLTIAAAATQICFPSREGCLDCNCATAFIISGRVCFEGVGATVFHHRGCMCVARVRATVFHRLGARELCGCWGDGFPPRRGRVFCRCWGVVGGGILVSGGVLYASVKPPPPPAPLLCFAPHVDRRRSGNRRTVGSTPKMPPFDTGNSLTVDSQTVTATVFFLAAGASIAVYFWGFFHMVCVLHHHFLCARHVDLNSSDPSILPVCASRKYWHCSGNRHWLCWLFPSVPSDFTCTIAGNLHCRGTFAVCV